MFLGRKRIWLSSIVISLVLILCLPLLVWAGDSKEDLTFARELTREFWLYPYDSRLDRATDMSSFVEIMQEKDKWAYYFSPEELNSFIAEMEGSSLRFGFYLEIDDGLVTILSLVPGSPAAIAGIEAGGIITHIDGQDLSKLKADEILELFWTQPEKEKTFRIKTDKGSKDYRLMPAEMEDEVTHDLILEDNIGYIYIEVFAENLVAQFKEALARLIDGGMKGLILDLRDCPGGSLDAVLELSGCFVPDKVPALHLQNRNRRSYPYYSKSWPEKIKVPIVVLINEDTASAAELLAANIQDNHAAVIFGRQSYGKGLVQQIVSLPGQGGFKLTTDKYLSGKYQDIDEQGGVHPDLIVADTYDENNSDDWGAVMNKAIAWLKFQAGRAETVTFTLGEKTIDLDGDIRPISQEPFLSPDSRSYLPLRPTLSALGWQIDYKDGLIRGLNTYGHTLTLDLAGGSAYVDGLQKQVTIWQKGGSSYLPAAFFRDSLGLKVQWQGQSQSVVISNN